MNKKKCVKCLIVSAISYALSMLPVVALAVSELASAVPQEKFLKAHSDVTEWILAAAVSISCMYTMAAVRRFEKTCQEFDELKGEHKIMMAVCPGRRAMKVLEDENR